MAAPTDTDFKYYPGTNGVPTDDTSAIIGPINLSGALTETSVNTTIFASTDLPVSGVTLYYGGAYRKMESSAPSSAANPRIYNRAGALVNILAGTPSIVSTFSGDTGTLGNAEASGLQVRLMAQIGGVWVPQWINLNGTTISSDVAAGVQVVDAGTAFRWELALNGSPTVCAGDIGCFIGAQLCAVFRGTLNPRRGVTGQGNNFQSAEVRIAACSAKNANITGTSTNRLTAPSGVGAFSEAVLFGATSYWGGSDQSIVIPGGPLAPGDFFGYAVEFGARAIPPPLSHFVVDVGILCNPGT
jgi:hypothetical protein